MNDDTLESLLRKDHQIKMPGYMILFLADILKDRQIAIWEAMAVVEEENLDRHAMAKLLDKDFANEAAGCLMLQYIEDSFGKEFLNSYVDGKVNLNIVEATTPEDATIN